MITKEILLVKIRNNTKELGYTNEHDVDKAYNLALELESENKIEIKHISKTNMRLEIDAKVK